jgi:hypothetical protein
MFECYFLGSPFSLQCVLGCEFGSMGRVVKLSCIYKFIPFTSVHPHSHGRKSKTIGDQAESASLAFSQPTFNDSQNGRKQFGHLRKKKAPMPFWQSFKFRRNMLVSALMGIPTPYAQLQVNDPSRPPSNPSLHLQHFTNSLISTGCSPLFNAKHGAFPKGRGI